MTREEYKKAKQEIFNNAEKRAENIMKKYENYTQNRNVNGILDGEPWIKELREDSKRVLEELKELDKEYNK